MNTPPDHALHPNPAFAPCFHSKPFVGRVGQIGSLGAAMRFTRHKTLVAIAMTLVVAAITLFCFLPRKSQSSSRRLSWEGWRYSRIVLREDVYRRCRAWLALGTAIGDPFVIA